MAIVEPKPGPMLRILGPTLHVPKESQSLAEAQRKGLVSGPPPTVPDGFRLPISRRGPVDLAYAAGAAALAAAAVGPDDIDDLLYAWMFQQGGSFFSSPAHTVARRLRLRHAHPIGVRQLCNGAGAALAIAARMATRNAITTTLIATSDVFAQPNFRRWSADYGVLFGDGATAMVVTNDPSVVSPTGGPESTLAAIRSHTLIEVENLHPQGSQAETGTDTPPHVDRQAWEALNSAKRDLLRVALAHVIEDAKRANAAPNGRVYLPRVLASTIDAVYRPAISAVTDLPVEVLGNNTGHLGSGDLIANLAEVHQLQANTSDPRVNLFISAGAGFTATIAAIETSGGAVDRGSSDPQQRQGHQHAYRSPQ